MGFRAPLSWALAPCVVGAVLVLQTSARLPSEAGRGLVAAAALVAAVAAWQLERRAPVLAAWLV
ncbi:MAG: hypothetical protein WCK28_21530, partial [Burkholderiales bacterium]